MIAKTGITRFAIKLLNPVNYVGLSVGKKDILLQKRNKLKFFYIRTMELTSQIHMDLYSLIIHLQSLEIFLFKRK
ncbi:unnamed protein product [Paramecium pentaurelia]|uniref:Uncharacterized protein n=1 Tax=Paramecium pentaurelia TaxID=43138 RepID=A0A8S1YHK3_9CILI|nr:unnamed protein product [Paramecium pentaurelia]